MVFRLSVRLHTFGNVQLDDYLVVAAWFMLLAAAVVWQYKIHFVYELFDVLTGHTPSASFLSDYKSFMPNIITWNVLFYSCLWSIKFSFMVFFRRLGSKLRTHVIWWWVVLSLAVIGYIGCVADIDWDCSLKSVAYITSKNSESRALWFHWRGVLMTIFDRCMLERTTRSL